MLRGNVGQRRSFALLVVLGLCAWSAGAQVPIGPLSTSLAAKSSLPSTLRADTNLVLIPVGVTDRRNRPVTGLEKSSFQVFDGKVEQQVLTLAFEDRPLAVSLVFDRSASMYGKMEKSRAAAIEFLRSANPEDEFLLVEFNDQVHLTEPWTSHTDDIVAALSSAPHGKTALLDAIGVALRELKKSARPRKALLILSDGGDNHSRMHEREILRSVQESDALIYAMGVFELSAPTLRAEEAAGPALLKDITEASGGRLFVVGDLDELPDTARRIGVELHNQYVLGYSPSNLEPDGKHHRVQVKVTPPPGLAYLHVDWRLGYRAPLQ